MSADEGAERPLKELLSKINHPLCEVRCRSLRSVAFKLNNGLVKVEELVVEKQFLIALLEWFNFEEWTFESQVLELLSQLTQHPTAAQTVVEVGGVEFLSQLRLHCDLALHSLIDDILEQLLKLPAALNSIATSDSSNSLFSSVTSFEHPEAVHHLSRLTPVSVGSSNSSSNSNHTPLSHFSTGAKTQSGRELPGYSSLSTSDVGSYMELSRESFGLDAAANGGRAGLPAQCLEGSNGGSRPGSVSEEGTSSWTSPSLEGGGGVGHLGGAVRMLYSESVVIPSGEEGRGCVARHPGTFPWLCLVDNDRNILMTTQSRLQSCTDESLAKSCEFIQDVLFQDFPAEVFLQRPALIKSLLRLLDQRDSGSCQLPPILSCLCAITHILHERVAMVADPSMALAEHTGGTESVHPLTTIHPPPSSNLETLTPEMLSQLQSEQISVTQFTLLVTSTVSSLLPCLLTRHSSELSGEKDLSSLTSSSFPLALCVEILSTVVGLGKVVREEEHGSRQEVEGAVDALCSALSQCLSKWRRLSGLEKGGSSCPQLQMVCSVIVQLTQTLSQILNSHQTSGVVPLPTVMSGVVMNGVLGIHCPSLLDELLPVFARVDAPSCRLFHQVRTMSESFHQISQFLVHAPSLRSDENTLASAVAQAVKGLVGLWFTAHQEFIQKAMELGISVLTSCAPDSPLWVSAKSLMLRLVGHGSSDVRRHAYKYLREQCDVWVISLGESADASSCTHPLLDSDLLAEICCHGVVAKEENVLILACTIVSNLLSISDKGVWSRVWSELRQWLPFLEVGMAESVTLCKSVQLLMDDREAGLDDIIRLQMLTRMLFSAKTELRVWSLRQVTPLLLTGHTPPPWSQSATPLHDVLILGDRHDQLINTNQCSFQYEDVLKLVRILKSPSMDESLKKSALDQLSLILRNKQLHEQVLQDGLPDELLSILVSHCTPPNESPRGLVKPCVKCLMLLTLSSAQLRERLAGEAVTLAAILRAGLFFIEDKEFLSTVSVLLAMTLFGQVVKVTADGQVQLPQVLVSRLNLPFPVAEYDLEECHLTPSPLDPELFTSDPLLSMLRLNYHSAMIGPPEKIITTHRNNLLHSTDEKMAVPSSDISSLRSLSVTVSLRENFTRLRGASTHSEVVRVLHCVEVVLRNWTVCGASVDLDSLQCGWREAFERSVSHKRANWTVCGASVDLDSLQCGWREAFERFLTVSPSSPDDLSLLSSVLGVLRTLTLVSLPRPLQPVLPDYLIQRGGLEWMCEATCSGEAMCLKLLLENVESLHQKKLSTPHRLVVKRILNFTAALLHRTFPTPPLSPSSWLVLAQTLCQCVEMTGSPDGYHLPLLEASLQCLLRLSVSNMDDKTLRKDEVRKLLLQIMTTLRQVLWSLVSGRGFATTSFLGRGVTSRASLALTCIANKCSQLEQPQGWWLRWVESAPEIGLSWLRYLVDDRDPQVRSSSLALLAILSSKPELVESLLGVWREFPFELWGVCLLVSLDSDNCDLVRQQALFVLVSLSGVCRQHKKWDNYLVCQPTASEGPLLGEQALKQLLHVHTFCQLVCSSVQSDQLIRFSGEITSSLKLIENLYANSTAPLGASIPTISGTERNEPKSVKFEKDCSKNGTESNPANEEKVERVVALVDHLIGCCSPLFVSGVCRFLHNLTTAFPQTIGEHLQSTGTLDSIVGLIDVSMLRLILLCARTGVIRCHRLTSWVRMVGDAVSLLRVLLCVQGSLVCSLLSQPGLISSLWGVLSTVSELYIEDKECLCLCSRVLELMIVAVQGGTVSVLTPKLIFSYTSKHWINFTNILLAALRGTDLTALRTNSLKMFSLLLVHSALPPKVGVARAVTGYDAHDMLDKDCLSNGQTPPCSVGEALCLAILEARDLSWTDATAHSSLTESLTLLLASSSSAKQTALSNGLLESTVDQLKSLGSKIKSERTDQTNKKTAKESPALSEYISTIHLLRNFMYCSLEVKTAVAGSHLLTVLHKQWSWYSLNKKALSSVLKLLSVFSARHPRGQSLLCQPVKFVNPSPSLLHSTVKLCSSLLSPSRKLTPPDLSIAGGLFQLMGNCALSQEGRAVIRKVGFMSHMNTLDPKSEKAQRSFPARLSTFWVLFLTNLSFSGDGQQMIVKQSGSLEVLTDLYWSSTGDTRVKSLLVLRNLCFYGPSKTLLASSEHFLSVLSHCLQCEDTAMSSLGTSALWALLHNCTKIRNALRQTELFNSLDTLHTRLTAKQKLQASTSQEHSQEDKHFIKSLKMAHSLLH